MDGFVEEVFVDVCVCDCVFQDFLSKFRGRLRRGEILSSLSVVGNEGVVGVGAGVGAQVICDVSSSSSGVDLRLNWFLNRRIQV